MGQTDELVSLLRRMKMSGILQTLDLRANQAVQEHWSYGEFLCRLLSDEADRRDQNQLDQRIRRAGFESTKTLEDFDFVFNPQIDKTKIIDLATCAFVSRKENVLLIGPTGVGKSHLAQALAIRACRNGHKVLYISAQDFFQQLRASRADGSYDRKLWRFATVDLLVVDDLGLRLLHGDEPTDLYEVIRKRYEKAATLWTSNRSIEELVPLFQDPLVASATMDRLLHHAHVLILEGNSFRNPPTRPRRFSGPKAPSAPA